MTTFAALAEAPKVDAETLIAALSGHASEGSGIIGSVVTGVIGRTKLSKIQLRELLAAAELGMQKFGQVDSQLFPSEFSAAARSQGAWLDVLEGEDRARSAKGGSQVKEACEYSQVASYVRDLIGQADGEKGEFTISINLEDVCEESEAKARTVEERLAKQFGERIEVSADSHHLLIRADGSLRQAINLVLTEEGLPVIKSLDDADESPTAQPEE